jgi:hypothetical protein
MVKEIKTDAILSSFKATMPLAQGNSGAGQSIKGDLVMELGRSDSDSPAMRTKMKGAIVKVLRKAKPEAREGRRFAGARGPGGYVRLAHTGIKKMFKGEPLVFGPRLDVAKPAPSMMMDSDVARLVVLAMNTLAPASMRASSHGRPVTITVPDEATAAIFREALSLTIIERHTDALIKIKVRDS